MRRGPLHDDGRPKRICKLDRLIIFRTRTIIISRNRQNVMTFYIAILRFATVARRARSRCHYVCLVFDFFYLVFFFLRLFRPWVDKEFLLWFVLKCNAVEFEFEIQYYGLHNTQIKNWKNFVRCVLLETQKLYFVSNTFLFASHHTGQVEFKFW